MQNLWLKLCWSDRKLDFCFLFPFDRSPTACVWSGTLLSVDVSVKKRSERTDRLTSIKTSVNFEFVLRCCFVFSHPHTPKQAHTHTRTHTRCCLIILARSHGCNVTTCDTLNPCFWSCVPRDFLYRRWRNWCLSPGGAEMLRWRLLGVLEEFPAIWFGAESQKSLRQLLLGGKMMVEML